MKYDSNEAIEALARELSVDPEEDRPDPHHIRYKKGWRPALNPIQQRAIDDPAIYKLYYGERYSGKTYGGLHELVEFCYRNDNVLAYIIVKEVGIGTEGGAWDKLRFKILPEWKDGLGIDYTDSKLDVQTKKPFVWISNRHGGWSMIMLASLPVAHQVEGKIRGREPQFILVDEAQFLESDTYFTALLMQLGRRNTEDSDPSKIVFCCNPEGPSHWLYNRFFVEPVNEETGEWDYRYCKWHIPITDNAKNLPPDYYENYVLPAVKNDPIAKARLVDGEWVDRPDGAALFADCFVENIHVKGDTLRSIGLTPIVPVPVIVSWDPGAAHTCIAMEQIVETLEKVYKLVFDEFDWVGEYKPYKDIVPILIKRQIYWEQKMKFQFRWLHVADSSAFNQYRAATGSFDVWDIEKISKAYVQQEKLDPRFIIKMIEAPKGEHSVEARVRMVKDDLITESMLISATCIRLKEMFNRLQCDPEDSLKPKKKSRYGHDFDALTYGFFWAKHRVRGIPQATAEIKPQSYSIG